ncbi:hypothetical protein HYW32_01780 [Candidatus Berkelbacteria bacterium]|nr:hypothetical protein [Candidatus Berkelbacteria bacterium]
MKKIIVVVLAIFLLRGLITAEPLVPEPQEEFQDYRLVYANLHTHTRFSDAKSDLPGVVATKIDRDLAAPDQVINANLKRFDGMALTDHAEHLSDWEWAQQAQFTREYSTDGKVLLRGFELTGTPEPENLLQKLPQYNPGWGHILVFDTERRVAARQEGDGNSPILPNESNFISPLTWMANEPGAVGIFAHPELYMTERGGIEQTFNGFKACPDDLPGAREKMVACELSSHGPEYTGLGDGKELRSSNEACYRELLRNKWRVGAVMSGDEHFPPYGNAETVAGLFVKDRTESGILEALRARRVFGTELPGAVIYLIVSAPKRGITWTMGQTIPLTADFEPDESFIVNAVALPPKGKVESISIVVVAPRLESDRIYTSPPLNGEADNLGDIPTVGEIRTQGVCCVYAKATFRLALGLRKDIISSPIWFEY